MREQLLTDKEIEDILSFKEGISGVNIMEFFHMMGWNYDDLLFEFDRGFWPGDGLKTSIHAICNDADHVLIKVQPYNFFHFILHMKAQEFIMPVIEMERITAIIKTIINWKTEYEADLDILDGYGWDIEYHFSGIDFKSGGYESFPSNYRIKVTELQTIIEELCQKYNPDGYDPRYRQKRIEL